MHTEGKGTKRHGSTAGRGGQGRAGVGTDRAEACLCVPASLYGAPKRAFSCFGGSPPGPKFSDHAG